METGELKQILEGENSQFIQRAKQEGPKPDNFNAFNRGFGLFLDLATKNIPPQPLTETVFYEGTSGILPPPAKKIVAKDILSGQPASPLKVVEDVMPTDKLVRPLDQLAFHLIMEVNPATSASFDQIGRTIRLLQVLGKTVGNDVLRQDSSRPDEPAIGIKKVKAVVHLLRRNTTGSYSIESLEISRPEDVEDALDKYQKSLDSTLTFSPTDKPSSQSVARSVFFAGVNDQVDSDLGPKNLVLPVFVFPESDRYLEEQAPYDRPFMRVDYRVGLLQKGTDKWGGAKLVPLNSKGED